MFLLTNKVIHYFRINIGEPNKVINNRMMIIFYPHKNIIILYIPNPTIPYHRPAHNRLSKI